MKLISMLLIAVVLFSGCTNVTEVDEKSFVTAIGFDKGEIYNYRFTFVFTSPAKDNSKKGGAEEDETIVIEAPSIYSAIEQINNFKSKTIELTHTQTLIFSEELAREGISDYIYMLVRSNHFRPNTYVCITDKSSMEFLEKINPVQTYHLEKYFQMIFSKLSAGNKGDLYLYDSYFRLLGEGKASVLPYCSLNNIQYLSENEEPTENPSDEPREESEKDKKITGHFASYTDDFAINTIAGETISKSDNPAEIQSVAVLKNGQFNCVLGRVETIALQMITNGFPSSYVTVSNPESPSSMVTCYLSRKKNTKIDISCANTPVIDVKINLEGDFVQVGQYADCIKNTSDFEEYLEVKIENVINAFLLKISRDINCDICGFSEVAKSNFLTVEKWKDYNWAERFSKALFNVDVEVTMRTYGELSQVVN